MDNFRVPNSIINVSDAIIDSVDFGNRFITISYDECINCVQSEQTVRLIISDDTMIFDERGNTISERELRPGMTVNVAFSSAMTRSIPPQAAAIMIRIVERPMSDRTTEARILDIDRQNRSFTAISDSNLSSITRYNVPIDAVVLDIAGRPMDFGRLMAGMRVRIRHASFMTASIPPQTTAFEVRVIR